MAKKKPISIEIAIVVAILIVVFLMFFRNGGMTAKFYEGYYGNPEEATFGSEETGIITEPGTEPSINPGTEPSTEPSAQP